MEELKRRISSGNAANRQLSDSHSKLQATFSAARDEACTANERLEEEVSCLAHEQSIKSPGLRVVVWLTVYS